MAIRVRGSIASRARPVVMPRTRQRVLEVVNRPGVGRDDLEAFRRGDPAATRTLYQAYGRLVYAVAHRVLGSHELAEEATQQTFVRAWQASDRIDVDRDPAAWLA